MVHDYHAQKRVDDNQGVLCQNSYQGFSLVDTTRVREDFRKRKGINNMRTFTITPETCLDVLTTINPKLRDKVLREYYKIKDKRIFDLTKQRVTKISTKRFEKE
jgi:hypothetical protein